MQNPVGQSASSRQLQETLRNMALALSCVDESVVWTDGNGRIQWCNAAFEQLINQTAAALTEQSLTALLPLTLQGEPLPLHPASWSLANQQRCQGEYSFRRHDRSFLLALTVTPLSGADDDHHANSHSNGNSFNDDGKEAQNVGRGVMLVIRDITMPSLQSRSLPPMTLALEETVRNPAITLGSSNRQVLNLLESMTDAFYTLDANWCFTYLNHHAERLLQRSHADLFGKTIWASLPETKNGVFGSEYRRAVDEQCSVTFETLYSPLNVWFEVRAYPIDKGLAVYFQDISERKRMEIERQCTEVALRESEQWFRSVFEATSVGMVITLADGALLQPNTAYCKMLGYTQTELIAKTCEQLVHPDDFKQGQAQLQQLLAGECMTLQLERRYLHKQGYLVWGLLSVSVVRNEQQQPLYVVYQIQDITARKQAEAILRESEQRFRNIFDTTAVGTAITALDGAFLQANATYCQTVGYTEAELLTLTFQQLTHPDDLAHDLEGNKKILAGEISYFHLEKRYLHKQGTIIWGLLSVSVVRDEAQQPLYCVAQMQNITDRKQAEAALHQLNQQLEQRVQSRTAQLEAVNQQLQAEIAGHKQTEAALRKSEERFRTIFDTAPIAISLADVYTYHIVKVNQAHQALLGYDNADLVTLTYVDITHPDDVAQNIDLIQQLLDGSIDRFQIEKRFVKKNGDWIWATLTVTLVRDPDGCLYSMGMIEDITTRKQTEAALKLTQFSIDRAADPIWWVEPDGSIYYVNDAACRDLGYNREAIVGKRVSDLNPDLPPEAWTAHWDMIKAKGSFVFEARVRAKGGTFFLTEVTANHIELDNKEYHCSFVRNITDRKQTENQLKASLKEKEILLKEIHHRVKNNLQTVYSLLNLQANAIQDPYILSPFKDSQHRVRAMALIHEKLYQSESLAKINFDDYVQHLVADLIRSYSNNPATIHVQIEIAKLELAVDTVLPCGLIINELISNALKYAFPDDCSGTIQICFAVSTTKDCHLVIADNGVGISESIPTPHNVPSSTLGLQLVQAFVQQLRGTVTLDRTNGSRFEISFPHPA